MTAWCALYYIWVPWNFSGVPDYAHGYLSRNFLWAFLPIEFDAQNMRTKFEVRSFTCSWDNRGYPNKLESLWIRPRSFSPNFKWAFVRMEPINVLAKFEVRSFSRSWDNRGCPKNWAVPGYAHTPFSPKFERTFVLVDPVNVLAKFEDHSFTRSWHNSNWSFGWGLWIPNLGEEEAVGGREWYRSKERWWVPIVPP